MGLIGLKFQQQLHNGQCPVRRLGTAKTEFHLRVTETHSRKLFSLYLGEYEKQLSQPSIMCIAYEQVQDKALERKIAILRVTEVIYKTCTM